MKTKRLTYAFKDFLQNGIGADLVRLATIKNMCHALNIKFYICNDDEWDHVPNNIKPRNWEYYFEPTIPVDINDEYPRINKSHLGLCLKTIVPASLNCSKFEYQSILLKEIYVPKQQYINRIKSHITTHLSELEHNDYVAIHIRRGDKVSGPWKEGDAIHVEQYLLALRTYLDCHDKKPITVYILSDANSVIHEIEKYVDEYKQYGITLIWDKTEIRRDGYVYKLYKSGYSDDDKIDEIFTFMKNIYILQSAVEIIGSRMSFFFITAELLRGIQGISLSNNQLYPVDFYD